jgi:hypothetical protein
MTMRGWVLSLVACWATSALGEDPQVCLARCLKTAKAVEADCNRHPKVPAANKKQECAEARKTLESMCPAECSGKPPRDNDHD